MERHLHLGISLLVFFLLFSCTGLQKKSVVIPEDAVTREYHTEAQRRLDEQDVFGALVLFYRAQRRSPEDTEIRDELEGILSSLEADTIYKQEVIRKGSSLKSPLQYTLYYRMEGKRIPVSDFPIRFTFLRGSGLLTIDALTNDLGIAKCYVEEIGDFDNLVVIEAKAILEISDERIELPFLTRQFIFRDVSIMDVPHLILVHVRGSSASFTPVLCEKAAHPFQKNSFSNVACAFSDDPSLFEKAFAMERSALTILKNQSQAGVLILISLTPRFVERQSADFFLYETEGELKIVDLETFFLHFQDKGTERGAGRTEQEAEEQSTIQAVIYLNKGVDTYLQDLRRRNGV